MKEEKENNQLELISQVDKDAAKAVPMALNEFEGLSGTPARNASPESLRLTVKTSVLKAYIFNARSVNKAEVSMIIDALCAEVLRVFPGIRLGELALAIHKGSMGEFEKVYSLSLAFFVQSIRTYMNSEARAIAGKKYLEQSATLLLPEKTKPTDEEIEKKALKILFNAYSFYKNHGFYRDYGNYVFTCLSKYGVINLSEEDKIVIWKEARAAVMNRFMNQNETSVDRRIENMKNLQAVKSNPEHGLIYIEAKKMALNFFFADLKKMETELSDLIEL